MKFLRRVLIVINNTWLILAALLTVGLFMAFVSDFSVTNKTSRTIHVTPVGALGNVPWRSTLPLLYPSFPHLAHIKQGNFEIRPGETLHLAYDMDEIDYKELAIESDGKWIGQVKVDSQSLNGPNSRPSDWDLVIDDLSKLQPISRNVALAADEGKKWSRVWLLYAFIILPWISTSLLEIHSWRKKQAAKNQQSL